MNPTEDALPEPKLLPIAVLYALAGMRPRQLRRALMLTPAFDARNGLHLVKD